MQHKVGYVKGINQDLANDKYSNQNYFTANNIKVITASGSSTGSIENEQGNKLLFQFPTVGARYLMTVTLFNTCVINGNSVSVGAGESNEDFYNKLLANSAIKSLNDNSDIYIFYNDSGVYIQVLDTTVTVTGTGISTYTAAVSTTYICGWTRLNEWLIVFTSDTETATPSSSICQIWKFKFTSGSRTTIDGASGTTLDASTHLIYNDKLNYSTTTYIRDIVSNYETSTKGRVYWTDYYNQVRVANVLSTDLMEVKPEDLGLVSEVTLSKPVINSINNNGSLPAGAHYQYYYKLVATDGRESIFSPGSQLIDVQEELSDNSSLSYYDVVSTPGGSVDTKEITVNITDVDSDFDLLELYCVIWESLNSPAIYKVDDYLITGSTMSVVHSNLDSSIPFSLVEFMGIGIPFTCKTLEDRDKQLVAGNIKESKFDIDFDARAYRHNSSGNFDILDNDGSSDTYTGPAIDYTAIPEDHGCINPTNDDTNTGYNIKQATKQVFKADGTTLGGEGTNVSYTFATDARTGATGIKAIKTTDSDTSGYNVSETRIGGTSYSIGVTDLNGDNITVDLSDELSNTKSAQLNANYQGYARGETYRFGIVFYSKTGQRSYVKWIGDIKMPDPSYSDAAKVSDAQSDSFVVLDHQPNTSTNTYNLYPVFTVDISSIQSNISGFEIVRVHRSSSDMTRLGTGILSNFVNYCTGGGSGGPATSAAANLNTLLRTYATTGGASVQYYSGATVTKPAFSNTTTKIDGTITVGTTVYGDSEDDDGTWPYGTLMLADYPSFLGRLDALTVTSTANKRLTIFNSPIVDFRDSTGYNVNTSVDYIQDFGYYTGVPFVYQDDDAYHGTTGNLNDFNLGFLYRTQNFTSLSTAGQTVQFYEIEKEKLLDVGEVLFEGDDVLDGLLGSYIDNYKIQAVCNTSYTYYDKSAADDYTPFGLGTEKQLLNLKAGGGSAFAISAASLNVYNPDGNSGGLWTNYHTFSASASAPADLVYFKEVAYCRQVTGQYGGNTYEARSKNEYITTGAYQIVDEDSATSLTVNAFGGDVVVAFYDREYIKQYHSGHTPSAPLKTATSSRMSVGLIYASECPINIAFRTGKHWGGENDDFFRGSIASDGSRDPNDLSGDETFNFDSRHLQSNNLRTDYLAKDILAQDETIFPNQIKVSRTKVDGELVDNWRSFPANQFDNVDGSLGEIHKLISYKDQLMFFQDRGVGVLPINERALIEDVTGAELVLGDGQLIGKYRYLTETSGTTHQHSVVVTDKGIYYYDSLQQKIYMVQGESLTEALGMHGFFHTKLKEVLRDSDDLYKASPIGVHGIYDKKNERVLWTFLGGNITRTHSGSGTEYFEVGDIVSTATGYVQCLVQGDYLTSEVTTTNGKFGALSNYIPGFTLGYRERLQAFESFYSYKPGKYLNIDDKLLSIDPTARNTGYVHEEGNYNTFYGNSYPSDITLVVMPNPNIISIFNNIEYYSEVTIDSKDIVDSTLDTVLAYNKYQNTGEITLTVGTIAKRRMRTWRHKLKRDSISTTNLNSLANPRLRDYYLLLKVKFDTSTNERLILSDVVISYTPTKM